MNDGDKKPFLDLLNDVCNAYGIAEKSLGGIKVYYRILERFSFEEVEKAVYSFLENNGDTRFFPKPGEIVQTLEGGSITSDEIIAAAKNACTPLGILCRIKIGTHDLKNRNESYLRQRAHECLQLMPQWKERALKGEFTNDELTIMIKYKVDPRLSFYNWISGPSDIQSLEHRMIALESDKRHQFLIGKVSA